MPINNNIYKKAYEFVIKNGFSVIPVGKNKRPLISSWLQFQSRLPTDADMEEWWSAHPYANYGVVTGFISGITVIDLDYGKGESTPLSKFPPTFTVKTPSGGYHLYYKYYADIKTGSNQFHQFPHLDIRNDGGYVVGPESITSYKEKDIQKGGVYAIHSDVPIAEFPVYLFKKQHKGLSGIQNFHTMKEGDGRNEDLTSFAFALLSKMPQSEWPIVYETIKAANSKFKSPLPPREVESLFESMKKRVLSKTKGIDFVKNKNEQVIDSVENIYRVLRDDEQFKGKFRFDRFTNVFETKWRSTEWKPLVDIDVINIQRSISEQYMPFQKTSDRTVYNAIQAIGIENAIDSAIDYLKAIEWDKIPRLDTWLTTVYGCPNDLYHQKVGSNWLKGLVMRLLYPGCKFDYVLVLEGPQGRKKSTSLAVLGGNWHVETVFTPDTKDFFMLFNGKAIIEFSEGESLSRTEVKRMKAVLTMLYDKYRPPYDRVARDFPRRCVFAMTTNQDQYLKDETGNRRWLPVRLLKNEADIEWLKNNRDQLFAEAYYRVVELKENTYDFPQEQTLEEQEKRQIKDPQEEVVFNWYFLSNEMNQLKRDEGITTQDAFKAIHGHYPRREMNKFDEMVLARILQEVLFLEKSRKMVSGVRLVRYTPTQKTIDIVNQITLYKSPIESTELVNDPFNL